ncbi:MAG: hypothetical protein V1847_01290 [Candidatus Diapherotrites archaeon]
MAEEKWFQGIAIAIPLYGFVPAASFASFLPAFLALPEFVDKMVVLTKSRSYVHLAERELAQDALRAAQENPIDYVFWMEQDHVFSVQDMLHLLKSAKEKDLDIVSGLYVDRKDETKAVAFVKKDGQYFSTATLPDNSIVKVDAVGFGFTLVKFSVLKTLAEKYGLEKAFNVVDLEGKDIGQDFLFCELAQKEGFKVWVHTGVKIGHDNSVNWPNEKLFEEGKK